MADPADYYREIYMRGLGGETPAIPVSVAELERQAVAAMEPRAANYVGAGAGSEDTIARQRRGLPRGAGSCRGCCATSPTRDLSTTVLGTAMPAPLMLAPIGVQKVVHDEGELATARAAAAVGTPMIASTASHFTLEEIAAAGGPTRRAGSSSTGPTTARLVESFVGRAERAGYGAIVVTVDTFVPGWKPRDLQQAWLPFLNGMGVANYFQDPVFRAGLEQPPEEDSGRRHRPLPRRPGQPLADLGRPRLAARADLAADPRSRGSSTSTTPARRPAAASTGSSSPTTAAARSTARSPRSTPCRRSPRRSATSSRSSSTAASAAAPTCSRRSPSAPTRSASAAPTSGAWRSTARPGVEAVLKMILAELDLTMASAASPSPDQLGPDCLAAVRGSNHALRG